MKSVGATKDKSSTNKISPATYVTKASKKWCLLIFINIWLSKIWITSKKNQ
jgi:hypothetical protein